MPSAFDRHVLDEIDVISNAARIPTFHTRAIGSVDVADIAAATNVRVVQASECEDTLVAAADHMDALSANGAVTTALRAESLTATGIVSLSHPQERFSCDRRTKVPCFRGD